MNTPNANKDSKRENTKASPSAYGWCFRVGAGITLMLDNVKDFTSLKLEGASDDIELTLDNGKIYAQAKSVIQMGDRRNASRSLNDALRLLSNDADIGDAVQLIYITNIENPLSSASMAFQYGNSYEFAILPDDAKKNIQERVNDDFPTEKFHLHILSFFGDGDNKRLLNSWFETFMVNASDKPDDPKRLDLSKKDIIYPVIVLVIAPPISENDIAKVCDYEFFAEVIGDYLSKRDLVVDKGTYKYNFVKGA